MNVKNLTISLPVKLSAQELKCQCDCGKDVFGKYDAGHTIVGCAGGVCIVSNDNKHVIYAGSFKEVQKLAKAFDIEADPINSLASQMIGCSCGCTPPVLQLLLE